MGQQLIFAAILAGFSAGVLITWLASRRQITLYRKETAAILNARDEILAYVQTLSQLVPQARPIKDQLQEFQKRLEAIELRETAHSQQIERLLERNDVSADEPRERKQRPASLNAQARSDDATALRRAPQPAQPRGRVDEDANSSSALLKQLAELVSVENDSTSPAPQPQLSLRAKPQPGARASGRNGLGVHTNG